MGIKNMCRIHNGGNKEAAKKLGYCEGKIRDFFGKQKGFIGIKDLFIDEKRTEPGGSVTVIMDGQEKWQNVESLREEFYKQTRLFGIKVIFEAKRNTANQSALNIQEGGNHYKDMKIQPVEFIMANNIGYMEGNVIKYVSRYKNKNGIEDLKKARHYIDMLIEELSK